MARIKIIHDPIGETLTVYFDDPQKAWVCEETGEGIVLIKSKDDQIIGFEKLYYRPSEVNEALTVETSLSNLSASKT
jgi:hypothetical protein